MQSFFSVPPLMSGIVPAAIVVLAVRGGVRRITQVAERVVPFMAIAYIICALLIVILNIGKTPSIFLEIARCAAAKRRGAVAVQHSG